METHIVGAGNFFPKFVFLWIEHWFDECCLCVSGSVDLGGDSVDCEAGCVDVLKEARWLSGCLGAVE